MPFTPRPPRAYFTTTNTTLAALLMARGVELQRWTRSYDGRIRYRLACLPDRGRAAGLELARGGGTVNPQVFARKLTTLMRLGRGKVDL